MKILLLTRLRKLLFHWRDSGGIENRDITVYSLSTVIIILISLAGYDPSSARLSIPVSLSFKEETCLDVYDTRLITAGNRMRALVQISTSTAKVLFRNWLQVPILAPSLLSSVFLKFAMCVPIVCFVISSFSSENAFKMAQVWANCNYFSIKANRNSFPTSLFFPGKKTYRVPTVSSLW